MTLAPEVLDSLRDIDLDWQLIPVDGRKRPLNPDDGIVMDAWATKTYDLDSFASVATSQYVKAVGVVLGPASGGLLAVDFDGPNSTKTFREIYDRSHKDLPATVGWSSGLQQRGQLAFYVPKEYWDDLRGRRRWTADGKCVFELRWIGHQSVIAGAHPDTAGYHWLKGRSPSEIRVAEAPTWLIEPLFKSPEEPAHVEYIPAPEDASRAIEILQHVKPRDDYDSWLRVGMALHSVDSSLLQHWVGWSRGCSNFDEDECNAKWNSFRSSGITIGSLFYMAHEDGYSPPRRSLRPFHAAHNDEPLKAKPKAHHLTREQVRDQLADAIDSGVSPTALELLIADLSDKSEQHPATLRSLISAIRIEREQLDAIAAQQEQLASGMASITSQAISLEEMLPRDVAWALRITTQHLPYVDHCVLIAYLAGISGLVKLGTRICGNPATRYQVPANLYACTVAKSGQKKTPLENLAIRQPTREIRRELALDNTRAMENWREQCRGMKKDDRPPQPVPMHLQPQDYTAEALTMLLQEAEKRRLAVLIKRDELSGLFGSMNAYRSGKGGDEQQLLELFDGHSFTSLRVSAGDRGFDSCHVSIYGGIQPEVLRELIKGGDPSGTWARFVFSPLPPFTKQLPTVITDDELAAIEQADQILLSYARKIYTLAPRTYQLASDAIVHFSVFESQKQQEAINAKLPAQGALCGKSAGKVLRLAGLLHVMNVVSEDAGQWDEIPMETLQRAISLIEYLDAWTLSFHEVATSEVAVPGVSSLMRRIHVIAGEIGEPVGWREIQQRLSARERKDVNAPLVQAAMQSLEALGIGVTETGSRGSLRYKAVSPLVS